MAVYLDEKTKKYYCKFRYRDFNGAFRQTTKRGFSSKREAKQYELDFQRKAAGIPTCTVEQLLEEMMASIKKRLKPASIRQKEMLYRLYILPTMGKMQVADITPAAIRRWQDSLPEKSPATILAINGAFSALLNYGVKFHGLAKNPFEIAGKTGRATKKILFWEYEQYLSFIKIVDNEMYHAIFNVFFYGGLRRGELLALTVDDIDFKENTISISKSEDDYGRVLAPKTKSSVRTISMPQFVMTELAAWKEHLPAGSSKFFHTSYAMLKVAFNKFRNKTDLPYISLHGLRHSHISHLIKLGVPITEISRRAGHANSAISLSIYSHAYKNSDQDVAKLLENREI